MVLPTANRLLEHTLFMSTKTVYFIRHAESQYNERKKRISTWLMCQCFCDPKLYDPGLSSQGVSQCKALRAKIKQEGLDKQIQLVYTSPLTRALRTCVAAFENELPVIVTPSIREVMDTCGDIGRNPASLQSDFPGVDFSGVGDEWWYYDEEQGSDIPLAEPRSVLHDRQKEFTAMLLAREESVIAVVSHSMFIKTMTGAVFKLANCGIKKTVLSSDGTYRVAH